MKNILDDLYRVRYSQKEIQLKGKMWKVLCTDYFQQFIRKSDTVLDIAAGHCEFINNIDCKIKYAVDIDKRISRFAVKEVKLFIRPAETLPKILTGKINVVFMGCFLEHVANKGALVKVFRSVWRVLAPGGRIIILNPNIRFSTSDYWDYFDHLTPVSDRSVAELLQALGFTIEVYLPKFVPNTIKDSLPKSPLLLKIYLRMPILFKIFGKQMFIVARKN